MTIPSIVSEMLARPMTHEVVTTYVDGATRRHQTSSSAQAENFATGERRKVGLKLISRETGQTVLVVGVAIVEI